HCHTRDPRKADEHHALPIRGVKGLELHTRECRIEDADRDLHPLVAQCERQDRWPFTTSKQRPDEQEHGDREAGDPVAGPVGGDQNEEAANQHAYSLVFRRALASEAARRWWYCSNT